MMVRILPADVCAALVDGIGQGGRGGAGHIVAGVGRVHDVCQVLRDTAGAGIHGNYGAKVPNKLMTS